MVFHIFIWIKILSNSDDSLKAFLQFQPNQATFYNIRIQMKVWTFMKIILRYTLDFYIMLKKFSQRYFNKYAVFSTRYYSPKIWAYLICSTYINHALISRFIHSLLKIMNNFIDSQQLLKMRSSYQFRVRIFLSSFWLNREGVVLHKCLKPKQLLLIFYTNKICDFICSIMTF